MILSAGQIGRLKEVSSIEDQDTFCILRDNSLFEVTASTLFEFFNPPITIKELTVIDSPYNIQEDDDVINVDASSGNVDLILPLQGSVKAGFVRIKKTDVTANSVTVITQGSDVIDDLSTQVISSQYNSLTIAPRDIVGEWGLY